MPEKDFYHVSLKAILRDSEGRVLAMKCVPQSSKAGYYEFPGGRIDEDEFRTPLTNVLARELAEELGPTAKFLIHPKPVAVGRHLLPKTGIHVLMLFFEVDFLGGEVAISDEHDGMTWLDLPAIQTEQYFTSGDREGIEMYLAA